MNNIAEIRHHMKAVQDTGKITGAMYLISSAKMRRARTMREQNRQYDALLEENLHFVLSHVRPGNRTLFEEKKGGRPLHIVIAGDKGLCGNYNIEVLRKAKRVLAQQENPLVMPIGHVAQETLQNGFDCLDDFVYIIHEPDLRHARQLTEWMLPRFLEGEFSAVEITYTLEEKRGVQYPVTQRLLPLDESLLREEKSPEKIMLLPDEKSLLTMACAHYVVGRVYAALVQSFFCEQYARMTAMEAAKNNAQEMLARLNLELNHARQAQITGEITEIVSGDWHPQDA